MTKQTDTAAQRAETAPLDAEIKAMYESGLGKKTTLTEDEMRFGRAFLAKAGTAKPNSLSDAEILEIGREWTKEPGWFDFERRDFVSCVRALLTRASVTDAQSVDAQPSIDREANLVAALHALIEITESPPDRNCSCHLSPPCSDCVDYAHIRLALEQANDAIAQAVVAPIDRPKSGNWDEDLSHENGNYQNLCLACNGLFIGHKRRVLCKKCHFKWQNQEHLALPGDTPAAMDLPAQPSANLWCVRIQGSDDIYAAESEEAAKATSAAHNRLVNKRFANDSMLESLKSVAEIWPWSAEGHAESLKEQAAQPSANHGEPQ